MYCDQSNHGLHGAQISSLATGVVVACLRFSSNVPRLEMNACPADAVSVREARST